MKYQKTKDKNIINKINIIKTEIHIDKLEIEIADLKEQIKSIPKTKEKPDVETLDYFNAEIEMRNESEQLETELRIKENLLSELRNL